MRGATGGEALKGRLAGALVDAAWAQRFALGFVVWSTLWIVISDSILGVLVSSHSGFWLMQTEKGFVYVLVSSVILLWALRKFEEDQQELRQKNEQRLRSLHDSGLLGIVGISPEGRISDANWMFCEMVGRRRQNLLHKPTQELLAPTSAEEWEKAQQEFTQHGRTGLFRCDLLHEGGGHIPVIAGKATIGTEGESIAYFLDVSPLVKSEERRLKLQDQLLQSEKISALGQFASGIAHNFNNELSVVVGYGAVLHEHLAGDATSAGQVQKILESAERSRKLIQRLLAFSRKQPIHPEITDVNAILMELQPSVRRILPARIELRVEVSPEPQWIYADTPQLIQALLNMINNAADAMPDGGVLLLAAHPTTGSAKPSVTIEVTDNGVGMDDQTAQRIFEPFFTTKLDSGGTGLGLATAHAIIQQNGGEIEVISRPKMGTTFRIIFPRHQAKVTPITQSAPQASKRMRGNVLLVEDRDDLRELMSQVLSSSGLQVIPVRDGLEAIQAAGNNEIDIILSDVVMPRLNGPEAVRIIRETHPDIKVVYVSGSADLIEPNGRDVVMWKPVKPQALLATIKSCLAMENKSFNSFAS